MPHKTSLFENRFEHTWAYWFSILTMCFQTIISTFFKGRSWNFCRLFLFAQLIRSSQSLWLREQQTADAHVDTATVSHTDSLIIPWTLHVMHSQNIAESEKKPLSLITCYIWRIRIVNKTESVWPTIPYGSSGWKLRLPKWEALKLIKLTSIDKIILCIDRLFQLLDQEVVRNPGSRPKPIRSKIL